MKISVIVAVYKDTISLELILNSLLNQSYKNQFEIIIAEDGESKEIKSFLSKVKIADLKHTTQEDKGWRKNSSLNNAIKVAKGELLIFIDGDCIPNSKFIENYAKLYEPNTILAGRRVELGKNFSTDLRSKKLKFNSLEKRYVFDFFKHLKDKTRHFEEGIINRIYYKIKRAKKDEHILGCNFAVPKEILYDINGFNEDYIRPSVGEDTDIEYRLRGLGYKIRSIRNLSVVFHLHHDSTYSTEDNEHSKMVFENVKKNREFICKNGIQKLS
jgi:cellulose synthase/poly-beta-1,6-N-acetylglucosamine synthase-like glycosyltransferase